MEDKLNFDSEAIETAIRELGLGDDVLTFYHVYHYSPDNDDGYAEWYISLYVIANSKLRRLNWVLKALGFDEKDYGQISTYASPDSIRSALEEYLKARYYYTEHFKIQEM